MPFILDADHIDTSPGAYTSSSGNTECVALVQQAPAAAGSSNPPETGDWRRGLRVKTAGPGTIGKGTVIATFTPAGTYPTASQGQRHAAVYLTHTSSGITVLDQWNSQGCVKQRTLRYAGDEAPRNVNRGDQFYVVETSQSATTGTATSG